MKKTTKILSIILIFLLFYPNVRQPSAQESMTFPENNAGISAYVKIDDGSPEKLAEFLGANDGIIEKIVESKPTHIIVTLEIEVEIESISGNTIRDSINPHLYLNTDGWMVSYFLKEEPSSKIMQWTNYNPGSLKTNILKEAIEKSVENMNASYSGGLKYYHFQYPKANRMTLVAETVYSPDQKENSFSIIVPGIIHDSSFFLYHSFSETSENPPIACRARLRVDYERIRTHYSGVCQGKEWQFGSYEGKFKDNTTHIVSLKIETESARPYQAGAASVFIYQVD